MLFSELPFSITRRAPWIAPEQARVIARFLSEFGERNEMDSGIKAHNYSSFDVPFADAFGIIGKLGRVPGNIVIPNVPEVIYRGFPLDVCRGIELANLVSPARQ